MGWSCLKKKDDHAILNKEGSEEREYALCEGEGSREGLTEGGGEQEGG